MAGMLLSCGVAAAGPTSIWGRVSEYDRSVAPQYREPRNPSQTVAKLAAIFPTDAEWGLWDLPACSAMTGLNPVAGVRETFLVAPVSWDAVETEPQPSINHSWLSQIASWKLLRYKMWMLLAGILFCVPRLVPILVGAVPRDIDLDPEFLM